MSVKSKVGDNWGKNSQTLLPGGQTATKCEIIYFILIIFKDFFILHVSIIVVNRDKLDQLWSRIAQLSDHPRKWFYTFWNPQNTALQTCNGLAGIRHFGTIETPRRTLVHFQHLACISNIMVNAPTYRIFLLWSSRNRSENLPSVDSSTLKFCLMPTSSLNFQSSLPLTVMWGVGSPPLSCWLREERGLNTAVCSSSDSPV